MTSKTTFNSPSIETKTLAPSKKETQLAFSSESTSNRTVSKTFDWDPEVVTAMVTPFKTDSDQSVDYDKAAWLANYLLQNGTDALLLTGSTGEELQLEKDEKKQIYDSVRRAVPKGTKIMVSTGHPSTRVTIENTKRAFLDWGVDAALVVVPPYIKPTQRTMIEHFSQVAEAVPNHPIIIYNIPARTGNGSEMQPETVATLASAHPNIIGIKQSVADVLKVREMAVLRKDKKIPAYFQIYSGDDALTLPMLAEGAKGVVSVASHLEGNLIKQMIRAYKEGHNHQADRIDTLLFPLYRSLFTPETPNPIGIKAALYFRGILDNPNLRTQAAISPEEQGKLASALKTFAGKKLAYVQEQYKFKGYGKE